MCALPSLLRILCLISLPLTASASVAISEFMADNSSGLTDEDGQTSDWIELYNDAGAAVNLAGWRLTDDPANLAKWTFPSVSIGPAGYLVVFASSKNRVVAGQPLHTNFKLDPLGEYLALVKADGTVSSEFAPKFPPQRADLSHGVGRLVSSPSLVSPTTPGRYKVVRDNTLATTWMTEAFVDTAWNNAAAGSALGWDDQVTDNLPPNLMGYWPCNAQVLTSTLDSSGRNLSASVNGATLTADAGGHTGLPGDKAYNFGLTGQGKYLQVSSATSGVFDAAVAANKLTLSMWIYGDSSQPTQDVLFGMFPNADGSGDRTALAHVPWSDGNIYFDTGGCCGPTETRAYKFEGNPDHYRGRWNHYVFLKDGSRKQIWQNGQLWLSATNTFPLTGIRSFFIGSAAAGGLNYAGLIDDVAVWAGALTEKDIQALYSGTAPNALNSYLPFVKTNLRSLMRNISFSVYLRTKFTLTAPLPNDSLALRMRYDDGFVAYLNGVEVARRNVPNDFANPTAPIPNVNYNVAASSNRPKSLGVTQEELDLTPYVGLLHAGTNVLAILGVNDAKASGEFLIEPELVSVQRVPGRYFPQPTPGAVNGASVAGWVEDTKFSLPRGFYEVPVQTTVTSATPGAQLIYTLDGSTPSLTNGTMITPPANAAPTATLNFFSTTPLRVIATKPDFLATSVDANTYLYTSTTISQPVNPAGYQVTWGTYGAWGPIVNDIVPADYEVDPNVVAAAAPGHTVPEGLRSLPAVCLSLPKDDLFSLQTGIYTNSLSVGDGWVRPASIEIIYPDGSPSYESTLGLRLHGGVSRYHYDTRKHSFSLLFQSKYGPTRMKHRLFPDSPVDSFDELTLRGSSTDSWPVEPVDPNEWPNYRATYIRDVWMKDTLGAMGHPTGHSRYVNLFLNGLYWGQYNIVEPYVGGWCEEYLGGYKADYDIMKDLNELESGTRQAWDEMHALANTGMTTEAAYQRIMGNNPDGTRNPAYPVYIDMPDFIDYMILHIYSSARDWPVHNWWAARKRTADSTGFKFFVWDQELTNMNLSWTTTYSGEPIQAPTNPGTPGGLYAQLRQNPHFQRDFGDRVQALCFHGGLLTPAQNDLRWKRRQLETDQSIVAESARWGDSRQEPAYTREGNWLPEMAWQETYWAQNLPNALARFQSVNLFPAIEAPSFNQHGGDVTAGFPLTMTAPIGTIYYTINGTDPFALDGSVAPPALVYAAAIPLTVDSRIKARVQTAGGLSALTEAFFVVAVPASKSNLVISEIHYHPAPGGVEFIELMNVSAQTIDLGGVKLTTAVDYTFPPGFKLFPGQRVLVVGDTVTFSTLYGPNLPVAGAFTGQLSNSGAHLVLLAADGTEIWHVDFSDALPWPKGADGFGPSLTLIQLTTLPATGIGLASQWRLSALAGGTPGTSDATIFAGNAQADLDHDGLSAFLEYALGTSDTNPTSGPQVVSLKPSADFLEVSCQRNLRADDVLIFPEISTDLQHWGDPTNPFQISAETFHDNGTSTLTWRTIDPVTAPHASVRIRAVTR